ncbi:GNAT family N-acetyltransferase [Shewanella sp. Choline-02u-19]|uniref:GNAT family N-acetyltransferase n=1 Tax=unclassified Shewanella TaxID=196818 RepID=UPI000C34EAC7|nr:MULTISPECIES: GNAT family N-acetyltransferase [unclassified Shewanella]PKH54239.1 GNAT family N-acetyltransferase [Shewanella sp. Bg11-22]PKI28210.1 GNAT family N-acetyltransferase [Shewanella sp. Choline-02u-19]
MLRIIPYSKCYAVQVSHLFHLAINVIADDVYSIAEKQAWSSSPRSGYHWHKRLSRSKAWLMIDDERDVQGVPFCCGLVNLETHFNTRGYIDSLYVHPDYQHRGIATALFTQLQTWATSANISNLSVDASKLSKPLFLSHGFRLHHRSYQEKRGQIIMGYLMSKVLSVQEQS